MAEEQKKKPIRIFTDGCFDMMHYGHANALRQAKLLGDYLVVGVHSDEDIAKNKGPPVMFEEERYQAVEACKWVDEVYRGAPYQFQLETLEKYDIDYVIHGDDIILTADGEDCYVHVKKVGKFKTIPRTRGVSTTDLVGRMLLMTKSHHTPVRGDDSGFDNEDVKPMASGDQKGSPYTKLSKFIPSTRQIVLFSEGGKEPADNAVIGYIDGTFDLFHIGHIKILKKAKSLCDYLVVGVHDDKTANDVKGENHPLTNLHERVLAVLSCRYVDEVVIGAPYIVTQELINSQNIQVVFHGVDEPIPAPDGSNPYELPLKLGIYKQIDSECTVTTQVIIDRILANRAKYLERNRKKEEKEVAAMENQA